MSNRSIIIPSTTNGIPVLVCLLAAILVCGLKLHRQAVYRLALYQVLASLALAFFIVMELIFFNYYQGSEVVCIVIGCLVLFSEWTKLLITMCVTFHLVCFGVFHKNMKKLEVVYVVTSLLVSAMVAIVPLTTHTFGLTKLKTCWIADHNDSSLSGTVTIEWFALWYGPAMAMLFVASTAMVIMVIKLICWRRVYGPLTYGDRFSEALKQLLPLAAFPILFFIFMVPSFVHYIYQATNPSAPVTEAQSLATLISFSLWGMSSGATLIIHTCAARLYCARQKTYRYGAIEPDGVKTIQTESKPYGHSATSFPLPADSLS